jgi:hypothetical protein
VATAGDPESMASQVARLARDHDLREGLRRDARNTIETSFNISTQVDGIERILYAARNSCVPCPN